MRISKPPRCVVVFVTVPSPAVARRMARRVVRARLAACVNIVPGVESLFWWKGKVDCTRECVLILKTTPARFEPLKRAVLQAHPYEVPEVIAVPVASGHRPYLTWLERSVNVKTPSDSLTCGERLRHT